MRILVYLMIAVSMTLAPWARADEKAERLKAAVTIAPLKALVEGVTKDTADITVMVPPGADPHTYEPKPSDLKELSSADVYVKLGSGIDLERVWMDKFKALNRKMRVCDSGEGIDLIDIEGRDQGHDHGHDHDREYGDKDPHIWLSPANAIVMVKNIQRSLSAADPDNADFYAVNAGEYIVELTKLDADIRAMLASKKGRAFIVFHPDMGYFAKEYGLKQVSIQGVGREPTAKKIAEVVKEAREAGTTAVFVSPQFSKRSAEVVAGEIGAGVITVNPLSSDYMSSLRNIAEELARSLK